VPGELVCSEAGVGSLAPCPVSQLQIQARFCSLAGSAVPPRSAGFRLAARVPPTAPPWQVSSGTNRRRYIALDIGWRIVVLTL
jgi:hypothetical protein